MPVERPIVGGTATYRGRKICARFMGPDYLAFVDSTELAGFFTDVEAAHQAGMRHVDAEEKAKEQAAKKACR